MKKLNIIMCTALMLSANLVYAQKANKAMFESFKTHDVEMLKKSIADGADVNALDVNGSPVLNSAAIWPDMTQILIDAKADVNSSGKIDMSPLMIAAMMSAPESMRILVQAGANPNFAMKDGNSILHFATWRSNCAECVKILIDAGADINAKSNSGETPITIMMTASTAKYRAETVQYTTNAYKAAGVTVMPDKFMNPKESDWDDPDAIIKLLIEAGADVNASNVVGTTPLITAAFFNKSDLIKMLIGAGADVNQKDKSGISPIMYAAERDSKDAIAILLDNGVDINNTFKWFETKLQADMKDFTLLAMAASKNNVELVKYLIGRGAECTVATHGMFPINTGNGVCLAQVKNKYVLNYATETGNLELVKAIVEGCNLKTYSFTWQQFEVKPSSVSKASGCYGGGKYTRASDYAKSIGQKEIYEYLKANNL